MIKLPLYWYQIPIAIYNNNPVIKHLKGNQQYKMVLPCYESCPNFNSIICTYSRNNISANSILMLAYKTLSIKKCERVLICQCKKEMFSTMSEKCINWHNESQGNDDI